MLSRVRAIIAAGIPVLGHVGLLPQSVITPDGYRAKGRDAQHALEIIADARELAAAGCAALIVEAVPAAVAELLTARVDVPVIGIGAGAGVDGQVLVFHDLLGLGEGHVARFVERYADGRATLEAGARRWAEDVRARRFPSAGHTYAIAPEELAIVSERLGRE
jgi:3-methyl-2-oxobutanoate hydroxymethyltransferase